MTHESLSSLRPQPWLRALLALGWVMLLARPAVATPNAANPPLRAGGALQGPARLLLGRDTSATFSVSFQGSAPPRLSASSGHFDAATLQPDGSWKAVYHVPSDRIPRAVIALARDATGAPLGWTVVPLWGNPTLSIDSEPNAQVSVRVAGREYGPTTTDAEGHARLRVEVPPGTRQATLRAKDALGNRRERPLPLAIAPFARVVAACPTATDDRLWLFSVDARGRPEARTPLDPQMEGGQLSKLERRAPGVWNARLSAQAGNLAKTAMIRVRQRGRSDAVATCEAELPGELPNAVSLSAAPADDPGSSASSVVAGSAVSLRVRLSYAGQRHPIADRLRLRASRGRLGKPQKLAPDEYSVEFRAPESLAQANREQIVVELLDSGLEASLELSLRAGPVARIELAPEPLALPADGESERLIRARVVDAFGNPIAGARLSARALGSVSPFRQGTEGYWEARYRAPRSPIERVDRVQLQVEPAGPTQTAPVRLFAKAGTLRLSARLGVSHNFGVLTTPLSLLRLSARLPVLDGRAFAGVQAGWFGGGTERRDLDDRVDVSTRVSAVPALLLAGYALPLGAVELTAGVEGGLVVAQTRIESELTGVDEQIAAHAAFGGFFGAEVALGPGHVALEAALLRASATGSASGNLAGLQLSGGYGVDL